MLQTHPLIFTGVPISEAAALDGALLPCRQPATMCATSRMVVKHKGAAQPSVIACTLLPYDPLWDLGPSLAGASGAVSLNHPHCVKFCVLGGAACSRG